LTWYYGCFHGIFKTPEDSVDSEDEPSLKRQNAGEAIDERGDFDDATGLDDFATAVKLSLTSAKSNRVSGDKNDVIVLNDAAGTDDVSTAKNRVSGDKNDVIVLDDAAGTDDVSAAKNHVSGETNDVIVLDDAVGQDKVSNAMKKGGSGEKNDVNVLGKTNGNQNANFETVVGVSPARALKLGDTCWFGDRKAKVLRLTVTSGLVTHYFVKVVPPIGDEFQSIETFLEAEEVHKTLIERQMKKSQSKALNQKQARERDDADYNEAQDKYRRGELRFEPGPSPPNSPHQTISLRVACPVSASELPTEVPAPPYAHGVINQTFSSASQANCENPFHTVDDTNFDQFTNHENRNDDSGDESENYHVSDSEEDVPLRNESAVEANEVAAKVSIELSTISSEEIWDLLINKKFRGGVLARSLFIAATGLDVKICEPWIGIKKLASKKKELEDQRSSFLQWANTSKRVLEWIRLELFKLVLHKQTTYKNFSVTHASVSKQDLQKELGGKTAESVQVTDDVMARIAHIVCDSECRVILNMLFDKKIREGFDAADLQPDKLWQDLASCFVNNDNWEIEQCSVPQLEVINVCNRQETTSKVDVSKAPLIGLTGECVRLVFTEIRRMFTNLSDAVMKPRTGCNGITGEELYNTVWSRYVNGKYLFFPRPNVAMYVFRLWTQTKNLPKYTTKEMNADAQIRLGVFMDGQHFTLSTTCHTPRSDHQNLTAQTPSSQTSSTVSMQESITSYFSMKMKQESQSSETFGIDPPKPDAELAALLQKHELLSVWDSVNPFLFARTVRDFSFLSQARLDVHVPATKFPAVIRIRLEQCLEDAKLATEIKKSS
jgi:hypothetical protein